MPTSIYVSNNLFVTGLIDIGWSWIIGRYLSMTIKPEPFLVLKLPIKD